MHNQPNALERHKNSVILPECSDVVSGEYNYILLLEI